MSVLAAALALTAQITSAKPADPGADGDASADQRMPTSTSGGVERLSSQSIADAALVGIWQGSLRTGPFELRLVLNVRSTPNGAFAATLDSLDQGVLGIPVSTVEAGGNDVRFEVQRIRAAFEGSFDESKSAISGQWSQGGNELPLTLKRVERPSDVSKPQDPRPPYPYDERQVNLTDNQMLSTFLAACKCSLQLDYARAVARTFLSAG